jgi:hypothetical protein
MVLNQDQLYVVLYRHPSEACSILNNSVLLLIIKLMIQSYRFEIQELNLGLQLRHQLIR